MYNVKNSYEEKGKKVKYIKTTKVYERCQADTVKPFQDLNMNWKYKYGGSLYYWN